MPERAGRAEVRRQGVLGEEIEGRQMLLDVEAGLYFGLDEVGSLIWVELAAPRTLEELVDRVCTEYPDADREVVCRDVEAFLAHLREQGLLEGASPCP